MGVLAVLFAVAMFSVLPPKAARTEPVAAFEGRVTVRGAYHIHSVRSDGSGTADEIASAARRAGLEFIILTDHGDGTRPPLPPEYRDGVLTIDAVELNTNEGHIVALGLPVTPYPLAGAASVVIEDIHRLGGMGIAAHPGSPRGSLSWQAWDADFDGLEWLNADSEWRDEQWWPLARSILTLGLRPTESLAALLDRPDAVLARWDAVTRTRRSVALAGADAHAQLGIRPRSDTETSGSHVPWPGYELSFRSFSNHVVLDGPLTGNAETDASGLLNAIRQGRTYAVIDGFASPGGLRFAATSGANVARMGDDLVVEGPVTLTASMTGPPGANLVLFRDGQSVGTYSCAIEEQVAGDPGVYRLEAYLATETGHASTPWLVSNPIYVGFMREAPITIDASDEIPISRIPARIMEAAPELGAGDSSTVAVTRVRMGAMAGEPPIVWTFGLAEGPARGQFAAISVPITGGLTAFDRLRFTVTSDTPARIWVQLRASSGSDARWGRTFYVDEASRMVDLRFSDFRPLGAITTGPPPLDQIDALLFVVDTLNTLPGGTGTLTLADVAFVR